MSDIILTLKEIEDLFYDLIVSMIGGSPDVRQSWPTEGAPAWGIRDDVIFIKVTEEDDPINRQRDVLNTIVGTSQTLNQAMSYNRVIKLALVLYGPNSWGNADMIRDYMFYQTFHDELAVNNLYLVTDVEAPIRLPELFAAEWWERVDFKMLFNEQIVRNLQVPYVLSDGVIVETEEAIVIADIKITGG